MNNKYSYIFFSLLMLAVSCGPKTTGSSTSTASYSEDLSYLRKGLLLESEEDTAPKAIEVPRQDLTIIAAENTTYYALRDSINMYHANTKHIDGFSIQLYNGRSREGAIEVKDRVYKVLPNVRPEVTYTQPSYRVKVGKYASRLEAHKDFMTLKREFPGAMIVPERITSFFN